MKLLKFLVASSIIAVASAQNQQVTQAPPTPSPTQPTPAPTKQVTPAPTQPTPAPTKQVTPAPTNPTPAPTKQPTPAPTTSCWDVSLENDATYCIQGPICSGEGATPAGWNCPKKGDIAVEDCYTYLPSYHGSGCIAPEDAVCKVIKTGAWGCVLPSFPDIVTPAPTVPGTKAPTAKPTPPVNGSHAGSGGGHNVTKSPGNDTIQFPTQKAASLSIASGGSAGGVSGALVGVIAAIAGAVCVVAAAVMYRRYQAKKQESGDLESAILSPNYIQQLSAVGSIAPVTPPAGNSKFAPSSTI